ncbi:MAG: cyclohexa-1,5-dienecarbonyl-CoA hydratase, partial [Candidatus Paceibacteria bacterium]
MDTAGINEAIGGALRFESLYGDELWRVHLSRPPGNILDREMTSGLRALFQFARRVPSLKLITVEGSGPNFSYGASVGEHLPGQCAEMLDGFHRMFHGMLACSISCHALVRGQCLGGGLELASFCQRVFAAPDARLGQPEIALGVLAPVASVILPGRVGRANAEDLCLSGRILDSREALAMGLVDEVAEHPWQAARSYFETNLRPHSASSL